MTVILATAFFGLLGLTGAGFWTLFRMIHDLRREISEMRTDLTKQISDMRADLARIEQKLDDHIATPNPAAHPAV